MSKAKEQLLRRSDGILLPRWPELAEANRKLIEALFDLDYSYFLSHAHPVMRVPGYQGIIVFGYDEERKRYTADLEKTPLGSGVVRISFELPDLVTVIREILSEAPNHLTTEVPRF